MNTKIVYMYIALSVREWSGRGSMQRVGSGRVRCIVSGEWGVGGVRCIVSGEWGVGGARCIVSGEWGVRYMGGEMVISLYL